MRSARHRTAWPVAVLVVLALGVTGCRKADDEHVLDPPVPVVARIVWEHDGEEHLAAVALAPETVTCPVNVGRLGSSKGTATNVPVWVNVA